MRALSERLEEIATHYDGDCCDSCDAKIISSIREGARLAKRYEDAPVIGFYGQRARILLDTEGV